MIYGTASRLRMTSRAATASSPDFMGRLGGGASRQSISGDEGGCEVSQLRHSGSHPSVLPGCDRKLPRRVAVLTKSAVLRSWRVLATFLPDRRRGLGRRWIHQSRQEINAAGGKLADVACHFTEWRNWPGKSASCRRWCYPRWSRHRRRSGNAGRFRARPTVAIPADWCWFR